MIFFFNLPTYLYISTYEEITYVILIYYLAMLTLWKYLYVRFQKLYVNFEPRGENCCTIPTKKLKWDLTFKPNLTVAIRNNNIFQIVITILLKRNKQIAYTIPFLLILVFNIRYSKRFIFYYFYHSFQK